MPLRNGKFLDEDSVREKWSRTPAMWNQWIAAVKNYAQSEEVKAGAVCSPMNFLSRKWRDFETPEQPLGTGAVTPQTYDTRWMKDLEEAKNGMGQGAV